MGTTRWCPEDWARYVDKTSHKSRSEIFKHNLERDLDPRYIKIRESCDSEANPKSTPIIVAVDQTGSAHSDPVEGFVENVDTISALVTPPTLPTVTRTSTLTMPDATTRTASILVESFEYERESGTLARAVLTITIPAGAHT